MEMLKVDFNKEDKFRDFLDCTNEKKLLLDKIIQIANPKKTQNFLDIGCGYGDVTLPLSGLVGKTTIIEPSKKHVDYILGRNRFIEAHNKKFEVAHMAKKFDIVLASYALDYISNWEKVIGKMVQLTKPGGYLFIVQHKNGGDFLEFFKAFAPLVYGKPVAEKDQIATVNDVLEASGNTANVEDIKATISIPSVEKAISLCEFFFHMPLWKMPIQAVSRMKYYFQNKEKNGRIDMSASIGLVWTRKMSQIDV